MQTIPYLLNPTEPLIGFVYKKDDIQDHFQRLEN